MTNGANGVHIQLREALENYIKSQYFGKSPILLSAIQDKLDKEGVLYQKPYVESSPAYKTALNGIQSSQILPAWLKEYFSGLTEANLGVYSAPFCHQISALELHLLDRTYSSQPVLALVKQNASCGLCWQSLLPKQETLLILGVCAVSEQLSCTR